MVLEGKVVRVVHGIGRTGFLPTETGSTGSAGSSVFGSGQDQVPPILPDKPPDCPPPGKSISAVRVMQDGRARTNAELAEVAKLRGIVGDDVDLRSIHSTMMSLMNAGEVTRRDDKWIRKVDG